LYLDDRESEATVLRCRTAIPGSVVQLEFPPWQVNVELVGDVSRKHAGA
jgi:hypothetical protein